MTEAVLLRLFTLDECRAEQNRADADLGLRAVLAAAVSQVSAMPNINCMCCGNALEGLAAYVSIVVSHDLPAPEPVWLAGICVACGAARSRSDLGRYAQGYAQMMVGEAAGHG